ncbi:MAG TPA: alanine--tRNA ligase [Gammaproteobacteria bacterium]|nr:alanine--tRNA ligase [Gammaproteobacteria bacterium]
MISSAEIRESFLSFFRERGHEIVPSSSLVPANDPTLLFTNAGMVPFKEVFLGNERRGYVRAASSQRCVRAGGKHNDLENVGYTARHHTFFEMLGNFSFGDYFKREAIRYAWEYLTGELELPPERLWVTVFEQDDEAAGIWLEEIGVDPERFARIGEKDNFWAMGDTGPCGPCSEIFYDHGPGIPGGPPGTPEEDGDRFIEIWNLVFMQYQRDAQGNMEPLPRPSVDTGMGLERIAAVMQGVHDNYQIDLFRHLIGAAQELTGVRDPNNSSLKVIADHIRAGAFLIVDGVMPSNEGRGYVLRRIIRRAIRHGYKLGVRQPFFHRLVATLVEEMGDAFPELRRGAELARRVLLQEEERFAETLEQGMTLLEKAIGGLSGKTLPGETVFRLYDTYGFPVDLTADVARERGLEVDYRGFEAEMSRQRERARAASRFGVAYSHRVDVDQPTEFSGYQRTRDESEVLALYRDGDRVESLETGQSGMVVLARTPFYAESGGQVGDRGMLHGDGGRFEVEDTRKQGGGVFGHFGTVLEGRLRSGDGLRARVDESRRDATRRNHSATHLLNAALRRVLGEHVAQKGSLVEPERLRFDFSHFEPLTPAQIEEIEALVNREIRANVPVETRIMPYPQAIEAGALALAGEQYDDQVRVLRMGDFSTELCGGTHVGRTGDIGIFKITAEGGVSAGVRRVEAVTGAGALRWIGQQQATLEELAAVTRSPPDQLVDRVRQLLEQTRALEKEVARLKARLASGQGTDLASEAREVEGIRVVASRLDGADARTLRNAVDQLRNKLGTAAVVLGTVRDDKVILVAGVTRDAVERLRADDLVNAVAGRIGGRGGGRADMAQAGGGDPAGLDRALEGVADWVRERLAAAGQGDV